LLVKKSKLRHKIWRIVSANRESPFVKKKDPVPLTTRYRVFKKREVRK